MFEAMLYNIKEIKYLQFLASIRTGIHKQKGHSLLACNQKKLSCKEVCGLI